MKPYFWWGLAVYYAWFAIFMLWEMTVPGVPFQVQVGGVPLSFFYNAVISTWLWPVALAYFFWYMGEIDDKKSAASREVSKGGS
jgi:hypothetical protein